MFLNSPNDTGNPDAGKEFTMPETTNGGSGSSHCSLRVALDELHEMVSREKRVALDQESTAQNRKDFRAADRHRSFAMAMQKVRNKVRDIARRNMIQLDE